METPATTIDGLLNRRVALEQPTSGYRVAIDTVLLAAAVPAKAGDKILDMGCGVGGAMLALACRVNNISGAGIEIQSDLVTIAHRNIARNSFAHGLELHQGDVTDLPPEWHHKFSHVLMNPPYHETERHDLSANPIKRTANSDNAADLAKWIASAAVVLQQDGSLTLIHRADRRDEILTNLQTSFGEIEILPILPKATAPAKRIIIRARKNALPSLRECQPLILHQETGDYTENVENILRQAAALNFM